MANTTLKAIGLDDSVTTCTCCGKRNLKHTVVMVDGEGYRYNYGTTCAQRHSGKPAREINAEVAAHLQAIDDAARDAFRASPEAKALAAAHTRAQKLNLIGRPYRAGRDAARAALRAGGAAARGRSG